MLRALKWIAAAAVIFLAWAALRTPSPEEEARHKERLAIEVCWEQQGRKSLTPDASRFIAGACEKMEADFKAKHRMSP